MSELSIYGTPEQVAALAGLWTRNGEWLNPVAAVPPSQPAVKGTNPTLAQVEEWLQSVSAQMNLALGQANFIVPFDAEASPNAAASISQYVSSLVADLAHYRNSSGRFFTNKTVERDITLMQRIMADMLNWISLNERGLLADGLLQYAVPVKRNQWVIRTMGEFPSGRTRRIP